MFSRSARKLLQPKAAQAFKQQQRRFASAADEPAPYPSFLESRDSTTAWWAVGLPFFAAWTYSVVVNTSHDIYYPAEAIILEEEYKKGLRTADYRPIGKSLDKY